jgi:DtxR family Mn-dependent transcriptional regulator
MVSASGRTVPSRSMEDYIKAIHELEASGLVTRTGVIARMLGVAPPSVSEMLRRLSDSGLVHRAPYRNAQLTPKGRRAALQLVRRHRLLETYLTVKLGYGWDSVHEEAERLEHVVSDEMVERMAIALAYPRSDPHGAPIPTRGGEIEEPDVMPLTAVPLGVAAVFRMVSDRDAERLRYLGSLGLRPGVGFEVIARQPFRGPVTIRIPGRIPRDHTLAFELAVELGCEVREEEVG